MGYMFVGVVLGILLAAFWLLPAYMILSNATLEKIHEDKKGLS